MTPVIFISSSITMQLRNRRQYIRHLRQNRVFQLRRVGDEGVERGDAADGSVEVFEEFAGDARGDFGAVTPRQRVFVSNDHPRSFLHRRGDCVPIVRTYGAQIYDLDTNPLLRRLPGSDERTLNEGAVGDD